MGQKGLDEKVRSVAGENGEAERSAIWWRRLIYNSMAWLVVQCGRILIVMVHLLWLVTDYTLWYCIIGLGKLPPKKNGKMWEFFPNGGPPPPPCLGMTCFFFRKIMFFSCILGPFLGVLPC